MGSEKDKVSSPNRSRPAGLNCPAADETVTEPPDLGCAQTQGRKQYGGEGHA